MKALSIKQPWAWLICAGHKDIENRIWATSFRGRIYVHAGKEADCASGFRAAFNTLRILHDQSDANIIWRNFWALGQTYGAIVGEVDIVDCKFRFGEENDNLYSDWHDPGFYGFVLRNPILYDKPIPCRGSLRFFQPEIEHETHTP